MENNSLIHIQNNVSAIKDEITLVSQDNTINGMPLDDFMYHKFLNRIDPIEYIENVLRSHLPTKFQKLHENQTALIRAVCNPKLKMVAGMMSRQAGKCFAKGTKILMADKSIKKVENIKIGDKLISPFGNITTVVDLGRGKETMYKIQGFDNSEYTVNESHILSLMTFDNHIVNINIKDYLKLKKEIRENLFGWRMSKDLTSFTKYRFIVVKKRKSNYYGFTLDSEDKLFMLEDYTVVHNTESISSFCGFLIDNFPCMRIGIFTPRLQQAEVSIGRLSTFFQMNEDKLNHKIVKITKDKVELDNGSYVCAVSASDQSNIEGLTFDVIVLDEAQKISDYTWSERIVPMGGATNAKLVKIGTPKTRNHFYDCVEGKASNKWTVIKRDWTQCAQSWALGPIYLPDPKTGIVRPYSKFIVEQAMPKALKEEMFPNNPEVWTEGNLDIEDFRTQYMLEFIDGAGKFLTSVQVDKMRSGEFDWLDHGIIGENYVAGIDFAGANPEGDATQISVLRVNRDGTKHKVFGKEFKDATYPEQMYYIAGLLGGTNPRFKCSKIFADYTGCGAAVVQTLQDEYGMRNIEGIIFNSRDRYTNSGMNMKNAMYGRWRQELDNGRFFYPTKERFLNSPTKCAGKDNVNYYHRMIGEWADLEQTTTGFSVNKKIEAPSGYHDDVCDADVLANFATNSGQRSTMPKAGHGRYKWR